MGKQQKASAWGLPSLGDIGSSLSSGISNVQSATSDLISGGQEMLEDVGQAIWGNSAAQEEVTPAEQETSVLDQAEAEVAEEEPKTAWQRTVDAYESGDVQLAVDSFYQMRRRAQDKLMKARPDIIEAMRATDSDLDSELEEREFADISRHLSNSLCEPMGYADFMAEEAWKAFIASHGVEWITGVKEGSGVKFPLAEFEQDLSDGVRSDGAIMGNGSVNYAITDGPMADPDSQTEVHVQMNLTAFFTSHYKGFELAKTVTFSKECTVCVEHDEITGQGTSPGTNWQEKWQD